MEQNALITSYIQQKKSIKLNLSTIKMDFLLTFLMDSNFGTLYLKTFPGKKTGIKTSRKIFENKTGE